MRNYQPGQVLVFHRPTVAAERHEAVEVVSVKDKAVLVRNRNGDETEVTKKQVKCFGVFAKQEVEVCPGDVLMLQGNRRTPDLNATNGERVTVKQFDAKGRMEMEDGRILDSDYQTFTYGYAATAHKGQGKTVTNVIISGNQMSQEQFYVGATRGRESIHIFTADKEWLAVTTGVSGARQSATELCRPRRRSGRLQCASCRAVVHRLRNRCADSRPEPFPARWHIAWGL